MAVAIHTVGINTADAGSWSQNDALEALGIGLSLVNFHSGPVSGLAVGISTMSGGGKVTNVNSGDLYYHDTFTSSTTGIGTGASFYIRREADFGGAIYSVHVNRPGYGYTGGEVVTISAEDIGGSANGATDLDLRLVVDADISGGVAYAITVTGGQNEIVSQGYDRDGFSGTAVTAQTYRFLEGDTITFHNDTNNDYSTYEYMALNRQPKIGFAGTDYVWSFGGTHNRLTEKSWTPSWGERGEYYYTRNYTNDAGRDVIRIIIDPADSSNISTVSYGSTTTWYDKNSTGAPSAAVLRLEVDNTKKYGVCHNTFFVNANNIYMNGYSGYFPISDNRYPNYKSSSIDTSNDYHGGHGYEHRAAGAQYLDRGQGDIFSSNKGYLYNVTGSTYDGLDYDNAMSVSSLPSSYTGYQLDLQIYQSGIDPNFAVFSWKLPTLSATTISGTTYGTFFIHNFNSSLWDYDHVYLGTASRIDHRSSGNISGNDEPYLRIYTMLEANTTARRSALHGYGQGTGYRYDDWRSQAYAAYNPHNSPYFYYRHSTGDVDYTNQMTPNSSSQQDKIDTGAAYNAVIKGIPLSTYLWPCPYYLPDDFVFIQFEYNQVSANIQQGDTVTISGSEVYTVIDGSYDTNYSSRTAGILFCARTT